MGPSPPCVLGGVSHQEDCAVLLARTEAPSDPSRVTLSECAPQRRGSGSFVLYGKALAIYRFLISISPSSLKPPGKGKHAPCTVHANCMDGLGTIKRTWREDTSLMELIRLSLVTRARSLFRGAV